MSHGRRLHYSSRTTTEVQSLPFSPHEIKLLSVQLELCALVRDEACAEDDDLRRSSTWVLNACGISLIALGWSLPISLLSQRPYLHHCALQGSTKAQSSKTPRRRRRAAWSDSAAPKGRGLAPIYKIEGARDEIIRSCQEVLELAAYFF